MIDSAVTIAEYLGIRLRQLGVEHLFGVPGDFNLNLLDGITAVEGLKWVGSPNELGAGYAADAYARRRGLSALFTTYGVGELSAINAVAGAYAEDSPVVHVAGSPRTTTVAAGALVHHTLADGDFGHFARAFAEVTAAQETLRLSTAGAQIDRVLLAALTHRKPVYLSVPQDLALQRIASAPLRERLAPASDPAAVASFRQSVADLLTPSVRPAIVVGQLVSRYALSTPVAELAAGSGVPVVTQLSAKGVVDESSPANLGSYAGTMLDGPAQSLISSADVVIHVGTALTAELTGFFTHREPDDRTVQLLATSALVGSKRFEDVLFPDAVKALAEVLQSLGPFAEGTSFTLPTTGERDEAEGAPLTQDGFWREMQEWLPSGSALIADTGTSYWGALALRLPDDTVFLGQPIWNSIGWALPAVLGQGLADPERRPILVIGDGAAQMTIQELGTIVAAGLEPIVLLLNNRGYTIERALQSPEAGYNDVAPWNWRAVVAAFAGPATEYHQATTITELAKALTAASGSQSPVFIEVELDAYDTPPLLRRLAERATATPPA
ncbi:thiamine pyrophosphate-binding protein [Actinoplanes sp. NPDC023714]|uniref:alpha-keto acid decarboxylase family protein n=1 Tax=Actinoplanes sp. NPDC023714 TaxID=3154322 RepID=UPI0033FFAF48